ncbi:hypothetical protein F5050DRAFT_1540531, partial [Lentinula boryana]
AFLAAKVEELEKRLGAQLAAKNVKNDKECYNCRRKGHFKDDCYRKGGGKEGQYPSWWRGRKSTNPSTPSTSASLAMSEIPQYYAMMVTVPRSPGGIFTDSAASDHFFRNRSDFLTY